MSQKTFENKTNKIIWHVVWKSYKFKMSYGERNSTKI